jgi:two-component system sensor histidine kinase RegB
MDVAQFLHSCTERFQLLRPEAELELQLDEDTARLPLRVPAGLRHALLNLLNNAADASAQRDSREVLLQVERAGDWLQFLVIDRGPGFATPEGNVRLGHSQKQTGLGIGLTLAVATAERLSGELVVRNTDAGAVVCLRLPLAVISRR